MGVIEPLPCVALDRLRLLDLEVLLPAELPEDGVCGVVGRIRDVYANIAGVGVYS